MKFAVLVSLLIVSCSFGIPDFKSQKTKDQKAFVDTKSVEVLSAKNKSFKEEGIPLPKLSKDKTYNSQEIKLRVYALFLFSIGTIGLFFSFVMNTRKKRDLFSSLIMGAFVFLHSLCVFLLSFYVLNPTSDRTMYLSIVFVLTLLEGPMLYFYFRKILNVQYVRRKDIFHVIPFLFSLHCVFFFTEHSSLLFIGAVSLVVYMLFTYFIYDQKRGKVKRTEQSIVLWFGKLLTVQLVYTISFLIYGILVFWEVSGVIPVYFLLVPECCMVLYISYMIYMNPDVLQKRSLFEKESFKKYRKSGLTENYSQELKRQLQKLFVVDKIYRDGNLTLEDVSNELSTSRHNISQVINEHFEVNFFQFINKYRVEEAVEILKKSKYKEHKMMSIAYDVGFNNKVTFNKAFKAEMNMTPGVFLKTLNEKSN